jgi:ubiquinone/menaquinone biosynthesis C-methylase UbiE
MVMNQGYVLRGGEAGAERLRLLGEVTWPTTEALLRRVGLREGMRCLDVGCGIGAVTLPIAAWVGPSAEAVGIDIDEPALELAHAEARRQGLPATFRACGVLELAEERAFDLVYSRFLLTHLPEPGAAIRHLVQAVRPGAVVVVEDIDFSGHFCHPACPAFDRYVRWYQEVVRQRGGDPCIGPRLVGLLRSAGLEEAQLKVVQPAFHEGEGKRLAAVTLAHIAEAVVAARLAMPVEVEQTIAELDAFAHHPQSILSLPRIFQVWGRKAPVAVATGFQC